MDSIQILASTTTQTPDAGYDADTLTLGLTLPLVFFGTAVFIVTICVFWHSRADSTNTTRSNNSSEHSTNNHRSFIEAFSFGRGKHHEARSSIRSDAPLHEQAIPNDFIPPVQAKKITPNVSKIRPSLPGQVNNTLTDSEHFQPDLSTVTEEHSSDQHGGHNNPAYRGSDPYIFDEMNAQVPIPAFHLATWLLQNTDSSLRALDTRQVRSDPQIVFGPGPPNSICESSEISTNHTGPSKSDYSNSMSVESSYDTSGSRIQIERNPHKSPFHPNHNSPMTTNSFDMSQMRLESMRLDSMRHSIAREGAPDQMADRSDISTVLSSNLSNAMTSLSNVEPLPGSGHVSMATNVVRYMDPHFTSRRQSSYGSSTTKIETSNDTMVLYESGLRAPPVSFHENSTSFISDANSVPYHQPQLEQIVASYNELHHRYQKQSAIQRDLYPHMVSADNSMHPQVGSSNTTARSHQDWDKQSVFSHADSENVMLAGGPLPLRPPYSASRRHHHHQQQDRSFNSDSDQSIARQRPRASSLGPHRHEVVMVKKRSLSQDSPASSGYSMEWDPHNPSPVLGPPLLNSTDLSQLRAQAQGVPVLARKQYWV